MKGTLWLVAVGLIVASACGWWWWRSTQDALSPELLAQAIETVAIAENGKDYRRAMDGWDQLLGARPNDRDLLVNQAVTVLKWISETNSTLTSNTITNPEKVAALEKQLPEAMAQARQVLDRLQRSSSDSPQATADYVLLESMYLEVRSRTVPDDQSAALRQQAAEQLLAVLQQQPDQLLLAGRLLDIEEELRLDWPEIVPLATEVAYRAWKVEPRNLLLLIRAGQGLADAQDKRLLEVIESSLEVARPMMSMMPAAQQAQPDKLLEAVRQIASSGDWSQPPRVRSWFNVLKGSPAYESDNKRLTPDIMALLRTSFLERWRASAETVASPTIVPSTFTESTLAQFNSPFPSGTNAANAPDALSSHKALMAYYDYDLDLIDDVVYVDGQTLHILPTRAPAVSLTLPLEPTGMVLADLWTVDSPQRPRVIRPQASKAEPDVPAPPTTSGQPGANSHDTIREIILWNDEQAFVVSPEPGSGTLKVLDDVVGLTTLKGIQQILVTELDGDGDLDLVVSTTSGLRLLQNNGNRTFLDVSEFSSLPPADWQPGSMRAVDYDRDLDLDIVMTSASPPHAAVLENILHSQFRFMPLESKQWPSQRPLFDLAVIELDGNASWDYSWLSEDELLTAMTRTPAAGQVVVTDQRKLALPGRFTQLQAVDINLDGLVDGIASGAGGLLVLYGDGTQLGASQAVVSTQPTSGLAVSDADGDGQLEIIARQGNALKQFKAQAPASHLFANVRIRGIADNKGGRVNHYGIGSTLEVWANGRYQAQVVDAPQTHFGLGTSPANDVRVIFTNGLTQNVIAPKPNLLIEEVQELKGSCPFVYGWDGERFQLITDLLWNAPLGLQVARGKTLPDRRWEHLLLPGHLVQPRDGAIELRVTEELWEVAYFDHITLTAVDHPATAEVWTNEKVGPPQLAEPRLFTASHPIAPIAARDGYDRDCLSLLAKRDGQYVQAFQKQFCQGLCETHWIELVFDPDQLRTRHDLRLVLTGWMHPTDTSLNIGIAQNAELSPPAPPSLWAPDNTGQFVCQQPFMGFPGGKPKTIVIDVSHVFTGDDTRLRIESSQQIYWDQAYLIANEPPMPLRTQALPLNSAQLHYRGFSRLLPRASDQPHWYDYQQLSTRPKWPPLEGLFSRYGDVTPQMRSNDDHLVVMASGDEMILRFELPPLELPSGWRRDYVLHSVGWDKDADLNTLEGQSSLPLPFAGMQAYPPTFQQQPQIDRVWQLNARDLVPRRAFNEFWQHE